ncbi:MAG TPA: 1-(5-phosphoribosyl)-5-[(5-phosphoribosylamino)methylideneamino]imidazole-4-carboxamide isomerase [Candidatus Acidoferrales bacterium]|nr:1-(5-phosphoribosyl)-5-[(5-phosphoribosylamino)methylideneamino]imidazole-4-carboxamide isomerase [Candidatus Acidoferrales bacterium]
MILVIPAIDLRNGKCVRLIRGEEGTEKIYSDDPVKMAIIWRGENFKTLHLIDLDGAFEGKLSNFDTVKCIVEAVDIPVEYGGGIRTYEDAKKMIDVGVYRIIIGTAAVNDEDLLLNLLRDFGPRRIAVGIDMKDGIVQIKGWKDSSGISAVALGKKLKGNGVVRVVYTDITRDGTLKGPNFDAMKEFGKETGLRVTASGGVSSYQDLLRFQELEQYGVDSVIVGKALYENRFPCVELWRMNEKVLDDLGPTRR